MFAFYIYLQHIYLAKDSNSKYRKKSYVSKRKKIDNYIFKMVKRRRGRRRGKKEEKGGSQ